MRALNPDTLSSFLRRRLSAEEIRDSILLKEGRLTADEWQIMRQHPTIGAQILAGSRSKLLQMAEEIALSHHEKWDGTGYPDGLAGEDLHVPCGG